MLLPVLRLIGKRVTRSRLLARSLFGVDFVPAEGRGYFDLTTPALVHAAAPLVSRETRVLDMGTGAFATIGLSLWRRRGCPVVSTDVQAELVERAQANVARNAAPVRVLLSRFFDGLDEEFDLVTFNAPYVPRAQLASPDDAQSDGGEDGTEVIADFLDAFAARGARAVAMLGVNALFVPRARLLPLLTRRRDLALDRIARPLPVPVDVYVIRRTSSV